MLMSAIARCVRFAPVLFLFAFGFGCGGSKPVEVTGTVTFKGKPAVGCKVCFFPDVEKMDPAIHGYGYGITDESGRYSIKHPNGTDGIKPGAYKVIFVLWVDNKGKPAPPDAKPSEYPGGLKNLVPPLYESPSSTPERASVPASGLQKDFAISG